MLQLVKTFTRIDRACARRHSAAPRSASRIGDIMCTVFGKARHCAQARLATAFVSLVLPFVVALVGVVGFGSSAARACACGCSVFDVGGLDTPQEQDHGGRVFFEFWDGYQYQNYVGSSRASSALNTDKVINSQWYNVGFQYMFNRDWGVMVRVPTTYRALTTDTQSPLGIQTFSATDIGDIEVMGMYTGFFPDMSTGAIFGIKFPTGPYTTPGIDRDTQIGSGSTDLLLGGFHRGLLTGDNAWQYFTQVMWRQPFLYRDAADPQGFFDGNPGVIQSYHPGMQVDGSAGILYNNGYNLFGFDKITPLAQVIISHRNHDTGTGSDPFNSGFDRVMLSPGIEFTKVLDEANNRVLKTYFDVEIPVYYRANAANNAGTEGQLVAPYLIKVVTSYNF
jgi:hypothetical protein